MLTKLYYFLHRVLSRPEERNEPNKGYWQDKARQEALLCTAGATGRLLEIGCGEGLFLTQAARRNPALQIWGIDHDPEMIKKCEKKIQEFKISNIVAQSHKGDTLPFPDEYFDLAVCINVFICIRSFETVKGIISQMHRVCKNTGKIIIEFHNAHNPFLWLKYKFARYYDATLKDHPLSTYTPAQIEKTLTEAGFTIIQEKCIGFKTKNLAPVIIIEAQKNAH